MLLPSLPTVAPETIADLRPKDASGTPPNNQVDRPEWNLVMLAAQALDAAFPGLQEQLNALPVPVGGVFDLSLIPFLADSERPKLDAQTASFLATEAGYQALPPFREADRAGYYLLFDAWALSRGVTITIP